MTNNSNRHVSWAPVAARVVLRLVAAGLVAGLAIALAGSQASGHTVFLACLGLLLLSPVIQIVSYVQAESRHGVRYTAAALAVLALLVYQLVAKLNS
jgi:hypothetical protein